MRALPVFLVALASVGCVSRSDSPPQTVSGAACVPFGGGSANQRWLSGDYKVVPVAAQHQANVLRGLKRGVLRDVSAREANAVSSAPLPTAMHYYLARIGYLGSASPGTVPAGISMSVDADTEGVAYVTTFRLGASSSMSEFAAVLTSPTALNRLVSTCGAAE